MSGLVALIGRRRQSPPAKVLGWALAAVAFVLLVRVLFDPPPGEYFNGFANGCLYGLIGVGIVLIYRTNRIINFAAAAMGGTTGILCALLVARLGWSWYVAFPLCIVLGG